MDLPPTTTGAPSSSSSLAVPAPPNQASAAGWWSLLRNNNDAPGLPDGVGRVVEWLCSKVTSEYHRLRNLEEEANKLRKTLKGIQALLADAEDRRHIQDESVKTWLLELKAVGFDADDLLDRYETHLGVAKLPREPPSRKRRRTWLSRPPFPSLAFGSTLLDRRSIGIEISDVQNRLREISVRKGLLNLKPSDGRTRDDRSRHPAPPMPGAFCDRSQIVGRDKECTQIVDALKARGEALLPVIPIYGVSGIGKTTLAQLVFHHFSNTETRGQVKHGDDHHCFESDGEGTPDEKGKRLLGQDVVADDEQSLRCNGEGSSLGRRPTQDEKGKKLWDHDLDGDFEHFEMNIWVPLPKGCDVKRATQEIIEGITKTNCNPSSLNILQHQLHGLVKDKKFLLVLDNFWAEDYEFWDKLRLPLMAGARGSKVLITTRNEVVWRGMTTQYVVHLEGLCQNECWKLFRGLAFPQSGAVDKNLEELGKDIVIRCQGSPLAAKSLGIILRNDKSIESWESILDEMWALEEDNNQILPSLMISYHHLTFPSKQCFAYCSVLPNGHEFDKDELVNMWIAEGLIQQRGRRTLENIGGRQFDYLLQRSFFEISSKHQGKYRMPSMIHDLACHVSKNELLTMEDNLLHVSSQQPRYASIFLRSQDAISFEKLYDYGHLRTLKLISETGMHLRQVPADLFSKLKLLRLLDLSNSSIEELPDSVGELLHTRALVLTSTNIGQLPESVSKLYNLKILELSKCDKLSVLPEGTSKLVNLRHLGLHLDWHNFSDLHCMPPRIGNLTSLQTLARFTVNHDSGGNIRELEKLKLRGELCICKLENIVDATDAEAANLIGKKYIEKLMLRWSDDADAQRGVETYEEVAKKLHPHTNLKCLRILNYHGRTFPDWLGRRSFSNLETLTISSCENCSTFPPLGLLPWLKNLHIERMNGLETLGDVAGFPSLETLTIVNMLRLRKLFDVEADEICSLGQLFIFRCPQLSELTKIPLGTKIVIKECPLLSVQSVPPTCFFG